MQKVKSECNMPVPGDCVYSKITSCDWFRKIVDYRSLHVRVSWKYLNNVDVTKLSELKDSFQKEFKMLKICGFEMKYSLEALRLVV